MVETVTFNGIKYRRYPNAKNASDRKYYTASKADRIAGRAGYLHRDVWKAAHGEIPPGFDIHHKDGDPNNNDVSNLECVERSRHHKECHPVRNPRTFTADDYKKAADWHRSEEGHKWHTRTSRLYERKCPLCGAVYQTKGNEGKNWSGKRFCSRHCAQVYNNGARRGRIQPVRDWDAYILCKWGARA